VGVFVRLQSLLLPLALVLSLTTGALKAPAATSTPAKVSPAVKALIDFETQANAAALRSNKVIAIENYEIPLSLVKSLLGKNLDPKVLRALVFQKDGQSYVRWVINPEDTQWHLEVEKFLEDHGVSTAKHKYFRGYQTASRSYIVVDPVSGAQFSAKVSTNRTGGAWKDKKQTFDDARQVRLMDDYVSDIFRHSPPRYFVYMDEPAVFGLEDIDQGMIIRSLVDLPKANGKYYAPGFAILHEEMGKKLARINGSNDPEAYWREHYNLPLARALAELAAKTGVAYDSPHSQNFLVELDANMKPTGRIVLRDLGDVYVNYDFVRAMGRRDVAVFFEHDNVDTGRISMGVGVLHGNSNPSWISDAIYSQWGESFFAEFNKTFRAMTGLSESALPLKVSQSGKYFNENISTKTKSFREYLQQLRQTLAFKVTRPSCRVVLQY
jgi:hypothetical protein